MPYIRRNTAGQITALLHAAEAGAEEFLPKNSDEVARFLGLPANAELFPGLDEELIRVVEDLIDVLIAKNMLRLTDLPIPAQEKLLSRKRLRQSLHKDHLDILVDNDQGLI